MIYEILLPLPIQKTFYYEQSNLFSESKKLSSGTLVEVEFKKKLIIGMILNSVKSHSLNKPIKKIHKIFNTISFNKEIINSINFISQYSCNKSSMILKLFLSSFSAKKYDNDFKDLKLEISNKPLKLTNFPQQTIID